MKYFRLSTATAVCLLALCTSQGLFAAPGFSIKEAKWESGDSLLAVKGRGPAGGTVSLFDSATGTLVGTTQISRNRSWQFKEPVTVAPCTVRAEAAGQVATKPVDEAPSDCGSPPSSELTELRVAGPPSVEEHTSASYTATAFFTDGSSMIVTAEASWSVNSSAATISQGLLSAGEVSGNLQVTVSATYVFDGVVAANSATVTIIDVSQTNPRLSHFGKVSSFEGTSTCLQCHMTEAAEVHSSVHYQWKGDTRDVLNAPEPSMGKIGGINDFCIYPDINWLGKLTNVHGESVDGGCAKCHAGLGAKPLAEASPAEFENIDCLICHSSDYKRTVEIFPEGGRFVPDTAKMNVSILEAAQNITLPSKQTCLNCHAYAGGGDNYKRGDVEAKHANPSFALDVHMASTEVGGAGMTCTDCHITENHRIAGRGSDLRPNESDIRVSCVNCHSPAPHSESNLDRHTKRVDCSVCHIPAFARSTPTDMDRHWESPGELHIERGLYEPARDMRSNVVPEYRFFNGKSRFYNFGEPAVPDPETGWILMSGPAGDVTDSASKIHAFKLHKATQPMDLTTDRLLPLKIGIFFSTGDVQAAIEAGAESVGWGYNGHRWADTERYMGIFHEVAPKEQALECSDCHENGNRMDFAALGYTPRQYRGGDPLCASCHEDESDEWSGTEYFYQVHNKHVKDKKLDCSNCHIFSER